MNNELFGVFGGRDAFERFRDPHEFVAVVEGAAVTVGVRDVAFDLPMRTTVHRDGNGLCVLWGEVYPNGDAPTDASELYERFLAEDVDALSDLNGSYVAVIERDGVPVVAGDLVRSWECYYTDAPGPRVFGTDAAAVARTIPDVTVDPTGLAEFLHLGGALNDRTVLADLHRVPHDHFLTASGSDPLGRFVYRPERFDYAGELADRLRRAIRRRSSLPGSKGLLLSAGYDSRTILAHCPGIDRTYTIGETDTPEVDVASALAAQYGADHEVLPEDRRYLNVAPDATQYMQGTKESLHAHQAGYESAIDADVLFHGFMWDTLFRGYFLPRDDVEVLGLTVPHERLDPDPHPAMHLTDVLGFEPESEELVADSDLLSTGSVREFVDRTVAPAYDECRRVCDDPYDAMDTFGVRNVLSTPLRTHVADNFIETFVAADRELVEWHLRTPPEHRSTSTFVEAMHQLDDGLFRHRPPDRPTDVRLLNQVSTFARRNVPFLPSTGSPWPDRRERYEERHLDTTLFPDRPELHVLPPRLKLRAHDVRSWLDMVSTDENPPPGLPGGGGLYEAISP